MNKILCKCIYNSIDTKIFIENFIDMEAKKMKQRISTAISELGLSMRQISLDMGKSESFVASVMSGKGVPSMELVYNILYKNPQINPYWLILGNGDIFDTSAGQNQHKDYKKLYEEERAELQKLRSEATNWRDTLLNTMKKNEELVKENARLTIEINTLKSGNP